MKGEIYISVDAMKQKKELLRSDRLTALQNCEYDKAEEILKEIQILNQKIYPPTTRFVKPLD